MSELASGLAVFENRHCTGGLRPEPKFPPDYQSRIGGLNRYAAQIILELAFRNDPSNVPAPPCRAQGPTPGYGTDFPHVLREPPGSNAASTTTGP